MLGKAGTGMVGMLDGASVMLCAVLALTPSSKTPSYEGREINSWEALTLLMNAELEATAQ